MPSSEIRLAGICSECMERLGVDKRLTTSLQIAQVSKLPELDPSAMAGVQFPGSSAAYGLGRSGQQGTTKITYKIAKTVKESIDEHGSHLSSNGSGSKH